MYPLLYIALIFATNFGFAHLGPSWPVFVAVGLTLVARDFVHARHGRWASLGMVAVGAAVSFVLAAPAVAVASVIAFAVAEVLDLTVFELVRRAGGPLAVLASGIVGSVVDSAVFLTIAFGSLAFFGVQVEGKIAATVGAAALLWVGERIAGREA